MSTNLPQYGSPELSGEISAFKKTILVRGSTTMTMGGTTGSVSVDITNAFTKTNAGMLKVECAWWTSSGGLTTSYQLPFISNSGASIITNAQFYVSSASAPGGYTYSLNINHYQSTAVAGDVKYFYYIIYSEVSTPYFVGLSDWDYRS